jgi:hypothetical protein
MTGDGLKLVAYALLVALMIYVSFGGGVPV